MGHLGEHNFMFKFKILYEIHYVVPKLMCKKNVCTVHMVQGSPINSANIRWTPSSSYGPRSRVLLVLELCGSDSGANRVVLGVGVGPVPGQPLLLLLLTQVNKSLIFLSFSGGWDKRLL